MGEHDVLIFGITGFLSSIPLMRGNCLDEVQHSAQRKHFLLRLKSSGKLVSALEV
jgi:hypothetical protein